MSNLKKKLKVARIPREKAHHFGHVSRMAFETLSCAFVGWETHIPIFSVVCCLWLAVDTWLLVTKDIG
jgi:hypothetical protein